ncbi:MAG: hypothetical protein DI568_15375 [Sphingomonas sp.]|nr:MAG: hypothetical protein DI568_15375 [Sphingomonas sp.]
MQAYVSYSFAGYDDEEDPYFPAFTFYTQDFLAPTGSADQYLAIAADTWSYSNNVALLSVYFTSNPHNPSQKIDGFSLTQRFAYPGTEKISLGFKREWLGSVGVYGTGIGLLTVAEFQGAIPAFTRVESDLGPFPGSTNIPVGGVTTQPGGVGGIPEPTIWMSMIAGFGLVGAAVRRRTHIRQTA